MYFRRTWRSERARRGPCFRWFRMWISDHGPAPWLLMALDDVVVAYAGRKAGVFVLFVLCFSGRGGGLFDPLGAVPYLDFVAGDVQIHRMPARSRSG